MGGRSWSPAPSRKQSFLSKQAFTRRPPDMIKKAHRRWAINTGDMIPRLLNFRVHRPLNTLRRQLKMVEGGPVRSRTTILRTGASDAQIEFVRLCESVGPKGGRQVGLDIQVQLLESIHSQSTPDTRAAQEQR